MFVFVGIIGIMFFFVFVDIYVNNIYFVVGYFYYVFYGIVIMGMYFVIYYWFFKMIGKMYYEGLG